MLKARRKADGAIVFAYFEKRNNGPFRCLECGDEVLLKKGSQKVDHFAHVDPLRCHRTYGESDLHRKCKLELYQALRHEPNVSELELERSFGEVRPDIFAYINRVSCSPKIRPVA